MFKSFSLFRIYRVRRWILSGIEISKSRKKWDQEWNFWMLFNAYELKCIQRFHFRFRFFPDFDISMPFNAHLLTGCRDAGHGGFICINISSCYHNLAALMLIFTFSSTLVKYMLADVLCIRLSWNFDTNVWRLVQYRNHMDLITVVPSLCLTGNLLSEMLIMGIVTFQKL